MVQSLPESGWGMLASLMAPMAKDTHIGMGYGPVSAREGERVWRPSRMPVPGSYVSSVLPESPEAGAPGGMKQAEVQHGMRRARREPHMKVAVLGAKVEPR